MIIAMIAILMFVQCFVLLYLNDVNGRLMRTERILGLIERKYDLSKEGGK